MTADCSNARKIVTQIPDALVNEIHDGNCVAFVGAGFSAAVIPPWGKLLTALATQSAVETDVENHVASLVLKGSAHAFDEAAQVLEDHLGRATFLHHLELLLTQQDERPMSQRLTWLRGIPFRSILTTNFDPLLPGSTPGPEAYRRILRPDAYRWWETRYWGNAVGAATLKLHGDVANGEIVLTRRDYRRHLYSDPAYITFLRTMVATTTVLYMGFSFEDAYLNELRSEILALLGQGDRSTPVAYAIVNDVPPGTQDHFRKHEGIEVLSYDTHGGTDFSGFDDHLGAIYQETNPLVRFGRLLATRRILWIDPHPSNNGEAFDYLAASAAAANRERSPLVTVSTAEEGVAALASAENGGESFDLVITHWGEAGALTPGGKPCSTAVGLLGAIRTRDLRCPVIVFASATNANERKPAVLGMGALAYCYTFADLYRRIEETLSPGGMTAGLVSETVSCH
ncbi:MAG: SIR2 family protein [bacterium]|nr:SIR2 family protein [bacterium]